MNKKIVMVSFISTVSLLTQSTAIAVKCEEGGFVRFVTRAPQTSASAPVEQPAAAVLQQQATLRQQPQQQQPQPTLQQQRLQQQQATLRQQPQQQPQPAPIKINSPAPAKKFREMRPEERDQELTEILRGALLESLLVPVAQIELFKTAFQTHASKAYKKLKQKECFRGIGISYFLQRCWENGLKAHIPTTEAVQETDGFLDTQTLPLMKNLKALLGQNALLGQYNPRLWSGFKTVEEYPVFLKTTPQGGISLGEAIRNACADSEVAKFITAADKDTLLTLAQAADLTNAQAKQQAKQQHADSTKKHPLKECHWRGLIHFILMQNYNKSGNFSNYEEALDILEAINDEVNHSMPTVKTYISTLEKITNKKPGKAMKDYHELFITEQLMFKEKKN